MTKPPIPIYHWNGPGDEAKLFLSHTLDHAIITVCSIASFLSRHACQTLSLSFSMCSENIEIKPHTLRIQSCINRITERTNPIAIYSCNLKDISLIFKEQCMCQVTSVRTNRLLNTVQPIVRNRDGPCFINSSCCNSVLDNIIGDISTILKMTGKWIPENAEPYFWIQYIWSSKHSRNCGWNRVH